MRRLLIAHNTLLEISFHGTFVPAANFVLAEILVLAANFVVAGIFVPTARRIYPSLVLVQPRKTRPYITERSLMGRNESNQTSTSCAYFRL